MPDSTPRSGGTTYTAAQLVNALIALGVPWIPDPEHRPEGPTDDDVPVLLGALLSAAESGIYCQALIQHEQVTAGWFAATPASGRLNLLWRRASQTARDLGMDDVSEPANCARTAVQVAERLLHVASILSTPTSADPGAAQEERSVVLASMRVASELARTLRTKVEQLRTSIKSRGAQG